MKVLVVAEYYPRAADPVLGIWAHRQALATSEAGVEIRVVVLHRPIPSLAAARTGDLGALRAAVGQPREAELDGLRVRYVRYLSPPRPWSYAAWGAWAARPLRRALERLQQEFPFDLVHAHNAVPAGDAVRRALPDCPLVVSVHGGDLYGGWASGSQNVRRTLAHARMVLANSAGTGRRATSRGARDTRVVHLGADSPDSVSHADGRGPVLVTVGNLIARKRHLDVIAALPALRARHPDLRYVIVGDGPERQRIVQTAERIGVADMLALRGRLGHSEATEIARSATLFVLPSTEEAFGVAYIEAMAGGVPAIGCRGEDGPEEIAAQGGGIELVTPGDVSGLTATIDALLSDRAHRAEQGSEARRTVLRSFTWEACGRQTALAYRDALSLH